MCRVLLYCIFEYQSQSSILTINKVLSFIKSICTIYYIIQSVTLFCSVSRQSMMIEMLNIDNILWYRENLTIISFVTVFTVLSLIILISIKLSGIEADTEILLNMTSAWAKLRKDKKTVIRISNQILPRDRKIWRSSIMYLPRKCFGI